MIDQSKKNLALGIVDFLTSSIKDGTIPSDDKESVDVAIDCISEVFGIDLDDKKRVYGDKDLLKIFSEFEKIQVSQPTENPSQSKESTPAVTDGQKKEAETSKIEGNRAMARQQFAAAVELYTKAIEIDPSNAIYLSNRAAAHSSLRDHNKAIEDAERAIAIDPGYAKAYSRLGLALYGLGDAPGALRAYERGIEAEGANPSEAMRKGYETAKKRVEEELSSTAPNTETNAGNTSATSDSPQSTRSTPSAPNASSTAAAAAGAGGLGGLFGGGGMPDLASLMNNPQISQMAQNLFSNPDALNGLINNPQLRELSQNLGGGQIPDLSSLMSNPAIQNMARSFMGGAAGTPPDNNSNDDSTQNL